MLMQPWNPGPIKTGAPYMKAGRRPGLGHLQVTRRDAEHHVHRVDHEADREVVERGQLRAEFGEPACGVRVAVEKQVDGQPEQTHQPVAAPAGRADADEFLGQRAPPGAVAGAQDAVVRDAQRLGQGDRIARPAGLIEQGEVTKRASALLGATPMGAPPRRHARCYVSGP